MSDGIDACPSCGEPFTRTTTAPILWCAGVATSHAYHHEGRVCVVPGRWVTSGEEPEGTPPTASAGSHLPPEKVLLQTRIGGSET